MGVFPRKWLRHFAGFSIKHTDRYLHETSLRSEIGSADLRGNARLKDTDARLADPAANASRFGEFARSTGRLRWKELVA